jgi:hypothetical protein
MGPSRISQPLNNVPLAVRQGADFVASARVFFNGGDVLIGFSASASTAQGGEMSIELWIDGEPTGGRIRMDSPSGVHRSLGRAYVLVENTFQNWHLVQLWAAPNTVTDGNDVGCVTVWEMGDGCAVRFAGHAPCPQGAGQTLIQDAFYTDEPGAQILTSASVSGRVSQQGWIDSSLNIDGDPTETLDMQVYSNYAERRLAMVPCDLVSEPPTRGLHVAAVNAGDQTHTGLGDIAQLAVVEWVYPWDAPTVLPTNPPLQNAPCHGPAAPNRDYPYATFTSKGGTLVLRFNISCWSMALGAVPLQVGISVESPTGTVRATGASICGNNIREHMAMVSNDLVLTGVPSGSHTISLWGATDAVRVDENDRISLLVMEFPPA